MDGWVAIGTDIHDRKLAEEALRQEYQKKDEFLAVVAHELRNPLAPMRNAVAILARKGPQDPEVAWSQSVIERQIDQLSRLIGDLVDLERLARGKLGLQRERVAFETVVDMALEESRPHVNAAGHRLSVLMPAEPALLDGDAARLAQVLATLVKNAAKHTPPRGTISFSAAVEGGEAVVSVEDSGAGFEPAAARASSAEAAGVGLRLAQGIVQLHGGRIEARSAGRGRGSEFIVRLPLARGAPVGRRRRARTRQSSRAGARGGGRRQPRRRRLAAAHPGPLRPRCARRLRRRGGDPARRRSSAARRGARHRHARTDGYEVARAMRERRIAPRSPSSRSRVGTGKRSQARDGGGLRLSPDQAGGPRALNRSSPMSRERPTPECS